MISAVSPEAQAFLDRQGAADLPTDFSSMFRSSFRAITQYLNWLRASQRSWTHDQLHQG